MGYDFKVRCKRCGEFGVETLDEWTSDQCPKCNDREIDHANERAEFRYYHPGGR